MEEEEQANKGELEECDTNVGIKGRRIEKEECYRNGGEKSS